MSTTGDRTLTTFNSFSEAYVGKLKYLLDCGSVRAGVTETQSPTFGRGSTIDLHADSFSIPGNVLPVIVTPHRNLNLPYAVGLILWSLQGSNDLPWLAYYDQNASKYSDDGAHLCGAFGYRLFSPEYHNQVDRALKVLGNGSTEVTALPILSPEDDRVTVKEYPCAIALSQMVRRGKLHSFADMRSQQAFTILPYDVLLFLAVHQYMSARLGILAGDYYHTSMSFHIYESERELVTRLIAEPVYQVDLGSITSIRNLENLFHFERAIREAALSDAQDLVKDLASLPKLVGKFEATSQAILSAFALAKTQQLPAAYEVIETSLPTALSTSMKQRCQLVCPS